MTLPETIAKLRELVEITNDLYRARRRREDAEYDICDLVPQLLTALEARESEKPREWWTVAERTPPDSKTVLHWRAGRWLKAYLHNDMWDVREDSFGVREALSSDIWREMPEAPVIGEGK